MSPRETFYCNKVISGCQLATRNNENKSYFVYLFIQYSVEDSEPYFLSQYYPEKHYVKCLYLERDEKLKRCCWHRNQVSALQDTRHQAKYHTIYKYRNKDKSLSSYINITDIWNNISQVLFW